MKLRQLRPDDYDLVIANLDDWWGGRHMRPRLQRFFFDHFFETGFALEDEGDLIGFLVGFISPASPDQGYIHFVGVSPGRRGEGLGRLLYESFFELARGRGCTSVHAVTSPVNANSVAFHTAMGFEIVPGNDEQNGFPVRRDAAGDASVVFERAL